jgi:hypothetical protein
MAIAIKSPQFLYHYTNVESLAYILSTKKIRFSCLSNVDDINDGENPHFSHLRNFYFVSCWTDLEQESIPFWNMYTKDMSGVRIKLPVRPFVIHQIPYEEHKVFVNYQYSIFPKEEVFGNDYVIYPFEEILDKITYTKNIKLLNPDIIEIDDDGEIAKVNFEFSKYAINKSILWRFQSEWRYSAFALPKSVAQNFDQDGIIKFAKGEYPNISQKYLYADIKPELYNVMEIVLGPKQNHAQQLIVKSLMKEFCPNAKITNSILTGTIRN